MNGITLSKLQVRDIQSDTDLVPIIRSVGQQHYENYLVSASSISNLFTTASTAISAQYATSSSYSDMTGYVEGTAFSSRSISSSYSEQSSNSNYSLTASVAISTIGSIDIATSASWSSQSLSSSLSVSSSYTLTTEYSTSSSFADTSATANYATTTGYATNAGYATTSATASYISALGPQFITPVYLNDASIIKTGIWVSWTINTLPSNARSIIVFSSWSSKFQSIAGQVFGRRTGGADEIPMIVWSENTDWGAGSCMAIIPCTNKTIEYKIQNYRHGYITFCTYGYFL